MTRHHSCRVSPFGHPRIHARLTAPRGISQPPTSFIGSQCQGIHHAPLNTYNTKPKNESPTHTPPKESTCGHQKNLHYTEHTSHKTYAFRCSQPLSTNQTPHPTTKAGQQHASHPTQGPGNCGPVVSKPNSVSDDLAPEETDMFVDCTRPASTTDTGHLHDSTKVTELPHHAGGPGSRGAP